MNTEQINQGQSFMFLFAIIAGSVIVTWIVAMIVRAGLLWYWRVNDIVNLLEELVSIQRKSSQT